MFPLQLWKPFPALLFPKKKYSMKAEVTQDMDCFFASVAARDMDSSAEEAELMFFGREDLSQSNVNGLGVQCFLKDV